MVDIMFIIVITMVVDIFLFLTKAANFSSFYLIMFLYYFIFEVYNGQTIGKLLTKTQVANKDGSKPGVLNIFIRSILRLLPIDVMSYLFGFERGLHDQISSTNLMHK